MLGACACLVGLCRSPSCTNPTNAKLFDEVEAVKAESRAPQVLALMGSVPLSRK